MKQIPVTAKHIRTIAWAFFWRWNLVVFAILFFESWLKVRFNYEVDTQTQVIGYALASFLAFYQIVGNFLIHKKFKGFRIVLTDNGEDVA